MTKPCFVHRDVSSGNVLVSPNLTCVLSDFGFAMKMPEIGTTRSTEDIITEVSSDIVDKCLDFAGHGWVVLKPRKNMNGHTSGLDPQI